MAGQLSTLETGKSQQALLDFRKTADGSNSFKADIKVLKKNGQLLFSFSEVPVTILFETNKVTVNIIWEDAGLENYKDQKLYGIYYASYCKMRFKNDELSIDSDRKLKLTYSG